MAWRSPVLRVLLCLSLLLCLSATISANKKKPPVKPVNINTATSEELQQVPGIGPATAQKILQMRKSYGPFKSVDDLLAIRGLGEKRLDKMRKYLTVGKPSSPKTTQPPAKEPNTSVQGPFSIGSAAKDTVRTPFLWKLVWEDRAFPRSALNTRPTRIDQCCQRSV
jgi:competence protein ComEA